MSPEREPRDGCPRCTAPLTLEPVGGWWSRSRHQGFWYCSPCDMVYPEEEKAA